MSDYPPIRQEAIIGRERALLDGLTKLIHDAVRSRHDYGPISERPRGATFEVHLLAGDEQTGRIARITVELDRVEGP